MMKDKKSSRAYEPVLRDAIARLERESAKSGPPEPAGIVAQSADGRLFFIPNTEAKSFEIQSSSLYEAYRNAGQHPKPSPNSPCGRTKRWLDSHSPHSTLWRLRCILYFENC